jgi:hypothetical protein
MPVKMTPEEAEAYGKMSRAEKISFTVQRKMGKAKSDGKKNPMGAQKMTAKQRGKSKELRDRERAVARKEGESLDVRKMQGRMREMIATHGLDPLEELFVLLKKKGKGALPAKEKVALYRFLVPYITPQLKAVDIQQETKMTVSVQVQSFKGASQESLRDRESEQKDSEYDEFVQDDDNEGLVVDVETEVVGGE